MMYPGVFYVETLNDVTTLPHVFNALTPPGHDTCVELLLEQEVFHKTEGNLFSPLHCAV